MASILHSLFSNKPRAPQPLFDAVAKFCKTFIPQTELVRSVQQWKVGTSPFSTTSSVIAMVAAYLITLFVGQKIMANFKPQALKPLFMAHNVALSLGSGLLLALMVEQVAPICCASFVYLVHDAPSETLYIINYLFKYWELGDTLFLVAKKKPLQFLHVFHHTATAVLCYTQLNGKTSVSWVPICLNLGVHVLMYYYYFATTAAPGRKIWWKRYLTTMQILQFVIDVAVIYFATYSYFAATYFANTLPTLGSCAGTEGSALFGAALITSYLFLFIAFYQRTYKQTGKSKGRARSASSAIEQISQGFGPGGAPSLPIGHAGERVHANGSSANGKKRD